MPDRSKEELKQIYDDLLEFKETLNWIDSFGGLYPTPMNGKTWEQEKKEYWNRGINAVKDLIQDGKVKSCEIRTVCEMIVRSSEKRRDKKGFWNHLTAQPYNSSEYPMYNGFSLDQFLEVLDEAINDPEAKQEKNFMNNVLDEIGTSACDVRACIENMEQKTEFNNVGRHNNPQKTTIYKV